MIVLLILLCIGCTSTEPPNYARTSGPMGVTDNGETPPPVVEDSGDADTGDTGE